MTARSASCAHLMLVLLVTYNVRVQHLCVSVVCMVLCCVRTRQSKTRLINEHVDEAKLGSLCNLHALGLLSLQRRDVSVMDADAARTVAHQDHLEGLGGADEAGKALRATEAGDEAEGKLGQTDLRASQGNASIAGLMSVSKSCALSRRRILTM